MVDRTGNVSDEEKNKQALRRLANAARTLNFIVELGGRILRVDDELLAVHQLHLLGAAGLRDDLHNRLEVDGVFDVFGSFQSDPAHGSFFDVQEV